MEPKTVTKTSNYPDRPITLIVPFSAGGGLDLVARLLEKTSSQHLGQPLIVVNKPGGAGSIGWNELAGANPDGYTLGITGVDMLLQPLYSLTKYNYPTALEPLVQVSSYPLVMVVQAGQPWQNVDDLVKYAKQHPGQLKFGNSGVGSLPQIFSELFAHRTSTLLEPVPFRGASEMLSALLGGHIQVIITNPATIKEHLKNGTIRALAVTSEQRLTDPVFAAIPTFKEQGVDIAFSYWIGVAAPKEMPIEVKAKLANSLESIILEPDFKKNLENIGLPIDYLNPEDSQAKWIADSQKLSRIVQETGILDKIKDQKQ
ncbi:MAG TPA: tripartite tricarboxylate transporter substrate binding protein [Negativicutes bacterium]